MYIWKCTESGLYLGSLSSVDSLELYILKEYIVVYEMELSWFSLSSTSETSKTSSKALNKEIKMSPCLGRTVPKSN